MFDLKLIADLRRYARGQVPGQGITCDMCTNNIESFVCIDPFLVYVYPRHLLVVYKSNLKSRQVPFSAPAVPAILISASLPEQNGK